MFKPTPNPPPSVFTIDPGSDDESLLVNSFEAFSSVSTLLLDLSEALEGKHRDTVLAIHQLSALGTLMIAKMLDRHAPAC
ncbi:hypothetical protein K0P33_02905 [Pseudomonas sp. ArH3a]|uniref:DUF6124 family protein n=1 Tax=Pseudomonas sp. ArH3a TaxID=2862945 RepID=UPI001F5828D5|nr:DUF6124 family protein [Pseudomonas sp. ArH3a]UNM20433.1 hypothetical protein K0P33_02905 [Pseudomonas sp. ArH3a]